MRARIGFLCTLVFDSINVNRFNNQHRTDSLRLQAYESNRRVEGGFSEWVDGWVAKVDNSLE